LLALFLFFFGDQVNFSKTIKNNLKFESSENLFNHIKIGLFIGVTISSEMVLILRFFGVSNILIILLLYLYPLTGLLTAFFISKGKTKEKTTFPIGYAS